jgi:hypothetical protein
MPIFSALPSTLSASARAGMPCGMPSSTLVRADLSARFNSSHMPLTSAPDRMLSAAFSAASPNTCGWRPIIFAVMLAATSSRVNSSPGVCAAMSLWKTTW